MKFDFFAVNKTIIKKICPLLRFLIKKVNDNFLVRIRTNFQFVIMNKLLGEEGYNSG